MLTLSTFFGKWRFVPSPGATIQTSLSRPGGGTLRPEVVGVLHGCVIRAQSFLGRAARASEIKAWTHPREFALLPLVSWSSVAIGRLLAKAADVPLNGRVLQRVSFSGGCAHWRVVSAVEGAKA